MIIGSHSEEVLKPNSFFLLALGLDLIASHWFGSEVVLVLFSLETQFVDLETRELDEPFELLFVLELLSSNQLVSRQLKLYNHLFLT